jgi:hypothetical protein
MGRLGQSDIASPLLELAQELKDPVTAPAVIALGDLHEPRVLPLVRAGPDSRSGRPFPLVAAKLHKLLRRFLQGCNVVDYAHSRGTE